MNRIVTTAVIDANALFREGLRRILNDSIYRCKKAVKSIDDIKPLTFICARDLIFLVGNDGGNNATSHVVSRLREANPNARIVVLADHLEFNASQTLVRAGADGYLLKNISCDTLVKSLDLVMSGVTMIAGINGFKGPSEILCPADPVRGEDTLLPARTEPAIVVETPRRLSDRETLVIRGLTRGKSNKEIARQLSVTEATVKVHVKAILRKISVSNRTQAAIWAQHHLIDPPIELNTRGLANVNVINGHL